MKRALVILALLWPATAHAQRLWQDAENTNGYVSVVSPPGGSCFEYQTAAFDIQCYTSIPSGFISVPNGVLEGVANAITGYTATPAFVQFGAASGGVLAQSTNLQWDGTYFKLGTHATSPQPGLRSIEQTASLTTLNSYPASGTNVSNLFRITPRGTGSAGLVVDNTDVWSITPTEQLLIEGHGTGGVAIATNFFVGGSNRPISIGTDDPSSPVQVVLNTDGTTSFGTGDLLLTRAAAQAITKSSGALTIGTTGANAMTLKTNGSTAVTIDSTQGFTFPTFAGGGNQCVQVNNSGKLGVTGSACGSGGLGGASGTVTNVTGTPPIFITGTPAVTPNVTIQGAIVSGSTSTTAQNTGSLTTGLAKLNVAAGVNTFSTAAAGTDYQAPLVACTDYVSLACVTGATDLGGTNATPTVTGIETAATMRGTIVATEVATPAAPAAGKITCWAGNFSDNWMCEANSGAITHGTQDFTCGANTWASSETANGTVTCTQPSFTNLSGSLSCGQLPGFTGDVSKSAGSCTTRVIGLTDGAAVDWPTSGAWANNQALILNSGHVTATNECNVFATCSASNDLGGSYPGPSVVAVHDGGGFQHTLTGTWSNNAIVSTDGSGHVTTETTATCGQMPAFSVGDVLKSAGSCTTKVVSVTDLASVQWGVGTWSNGQFLATSTVGNIIKSVPAPDLLSFFVSVPSLQAVNTANQQITTSSSTPVSSGVTTNPIEVPSDFVVKNVYLQLYLLASIGTASSVNVWATRNGTLISGTTLTFTPGTTATGTILSVGPIATGSASTSDTYGIQQVYNGNAITGPFGAQMAYSLKYRLVGY